MGPFNFSIDVPVRNEWSNVDLLRSSILNCFAAMFADCDESHTIAMVTGELLENAVKYGDWNGDAKGFRLRVWGDGKLAHVRVENPVQDGDGRLEELRETLAWIERFPTADEAYRARLMEVASTPHEPGSSKLGLVRIAYESHCRLSVETADGTLRVTAEIAL